MLIENNSLDMKNMGRLAMGAHYELNNLSVMFKGYSGENIYIFEIDKDGVFSDNSVGLNLEKVYDGELLYIDSKSGKLVDFKSDVTDVKEPLDSYNYVLEILRTSKKSIMSAESKEEFIKLITSAGKLASHSFSSNFSEYGNSDRKIIKKFK